MPGLFSPAVPLDVVLSPAAHPELLEMLLWAVDLLYCRPGMTAFQQGVNSIPLSVICKVFWGSAPCSLCSANVFLPHLKGHTVEHCRVPVLLVFLVVFWERCL